MKTLGNAKETAIDMRSNASIKKLIAEVAISGQCDTCGPMEPWEDCPNDSQKHWLKTAESNLLGKIR